MSFLHRNNARTAVKEKAFYAALCMLFATAVIGHFCFPLNPDRVQQLLHSLGMHAHTGANVFADARRWMGIPNAADVLSNLPFAAMGFWGFMALRAQASHPQRGALQVFFLGLWLTTAGSILFHITPNNQTLLWDRAGMAVAFAGVLGIAAGQGISLKAGREAVWLTLYAAVAALAVWATTQDVLAWSLVQFGGMGLIVASACGQHVTGSGVRVNLWALIGFYMLAKCLESFDSAVFEASGHAISGHTLKHLTASLGALPVILSLRLQWVVHQESPG